jgi:hypothetical protein
MDAPIPMGAGRCGKEDENEETFNLSDRVRPEAVEKMMLRLSRIT